MSDPEAVATDGRAYVLGCPLDAVTMDQALDRVEGAIERRGYAHHTAVNAAKIIAAERDPQLREIISRSDLVTADGQAVVWASRLLGDPLPERIAGIDLMTRLLARAEERGWRVYILGAQEAILEEAVQRIRGRNPGLAIAGYRHGYFAKSEEPSVVEEIAASGADILFVAMSSPRKEYFLGSRGRDLRVPFVMGVGGAVDVLAGRTRRAPIMIQRLGLEWSFRLLQEPRRLGRRYAETNLRFIAAVLREYVGRRR